MTVKGKKLCWNCDGEVHMYAIQCPLCGVDLSDEVDRGAENAHVPRHGREYEQGHYAESYSERVPEGPFDNPPEIPKPLYSGGGSPWAINDNEWREEQPLQPEEERAQPDQMLQPDFKRSLLPLFFLLPGAVFLLFSAALLFLSHKGTFTLSWNSATWPFYLLLSLPLIYFGWRQLKKLPEE